jgi:predicted Zn-dependent peptidase
MKTWKVVTLSCALAAGLGAASEVRARAGSVDEAKGTAPALKLTKKQPETFRLKNGIEVYYLASERLPLVNVRAVFRTGAIWEPADGRGVADLTGRMLRRGGTSQWTADEVDEELDFLAAKLSTAIGDEQGNVTLNVLSENLTAALAIFADIVRNPAFDESKIDVQKNLINEQIRRQNDNPIQVAVREYGYLLWGEDHPRARTPTEESVDALTRQDLVDFHAKFFTPSNVLLGVAGNVSKKDVQKLLEASLGNWKGAEVEFPEVPAAPPVLAQVAFAAKDVPQSTVLIGQLGPLETDPLRAAGEVMMSILGSGGFNSYITDRVRNDEGLAYAAGGFLNFGQMDRGLIVTYALSKTETTCQAADLILEQIRRIQEESITEEDLVRARDGILNSEAFNYDSSEEIVANLMNLVYFGLPTDHDERVIEKVGRVTKEDVRDAADALIDRGALTLLAVGNADAMDCEWGRYAEDRGIDLRKIELE